MVDDYEKVTLKACSELLKEYKEGFHTEWDVDGEIELYEESFADGKASASVPQMKTESLALEENTWATKAPPTVEPKDPLFDEPKTAEGDSAKTSLPEDAEKA